MNAPNTASGSPNSVVLVEDREDQGRLIRFLLGDRHTVAETASSVDGAVQAVEAHRPDVVIMDLNLESGNGLDATRRIKSLYPEIAVIVSSAYVSRDMRFRAFTAGARDYLMKPYEREELLAAIDAALAE